VIVLSWDGVRHDYPDRGSLPGLARIEREGVRAASLVPVEPSSTFPNHVSLATGTHPDRHGIVGNSFWDRERGRFRYGNDASWIEAEPLWAAAERQGVPAATFFWVGSETDWRGVGAGRRMAPFDSSVGEAAKVDRILAWLDEAEPPRLVMSWWHGADSVGHRKGPDHPDILEQLQAQDAELQRLLAGLDARSLWGSTTLLIVSDHGMTAVTEDVPVRPVLEAAGVEARVENGRAIAHVFLADPGQREAAEQALAALEGVRVERGDALPAEERIAHPRRTGDLVLRVEPPRALGAGLRRTAERAAQGLLGRTSGGHGYAADHPDMAGVFLAMGRGVPAGRRIAPVRAVDVAATVAAWLDIEPPAHSEGRPIALEPPP